MLINPTNTMPKDSIRRLSSPLGLMYIGAVLKNFGYEVNILDSLCEGYYSTKTEGDYITYGLSDEELTKRITDYEPDVVGITSMFSAHQKSAIAHCNLVKKINPNIPVVLGGIHPSLTPVESVKNKSVDFVIVGEGEFRFLKLLNSLNEKKRFNFDGVAYKKNGKIIHNPMTSRIENLDTLPLPARELVDMEKYLKIGIPYAPFPRKEKCEQMMVSRGCPFNCVFCSTVKYWGHKFRIRTVSHVLKEVDELVEKYGIQELQFTDDNLTVDKEKAKEIFRSLKPYNLSLCTPHGLMVNTLDEELIDLMADAGIYQLSFAIESGNQKVLKEMVHKPVPEKDKVKKLIKSCHERNIQVHGLFVVGFPGESLKEMNETFAYPYETDVDTASFFLANPMPGSELYERCKKKGYLLDNPKLDIKHAEINIPKNSPDYVMPREQMEKLVDDETRKFNEYSKKKNPNSWNIKFEQFLKKHKDEEDLILGRVT